MTAHAKPVLLGLGILIAIPAAWAAEERLTRKELPAAVRETADDQSRNAIVRSYSKDNEDGKLEYEVAMTVNGHSRDITIAPDGRLLEIEEEVSFDTLPRKVRAGLQTRARGAKIDKVESITKHGSLVAYEAQIIRAGKRSEIQVGPEGNRLPHEE